MEDGFRQRAGGRDSAQFRCQGALGGRARKEAGRWHRLHETTKVELLTYARENGVKVVKPFMLVIARGYHARLTTENAD